MQQNCEIDRNPLPLRSGSPGAFHEYLLVSCVIKVWSQSLSFSNGQKCCNKLHLNNYGSTCRHTLTYIHARNLLRFIHTELKRTWKHERDVAFSLMEAKFFFWYLSFFLFANFRFSFCSVWMDSSSVYYSYYVSEKKLKWRKFSRSHSLSNSLSLFQCEHPFNCSLRQQQHSVQSSLFVSASSCLLFKGPCTLNESELESEYFLWSLLPVNGRNCFCLGKWNFHLAETSTDDVIQPGQSKLTSLKNSTDHKCHLVRWKCRRNKYVQCDNLLLSDTLLRSLSLTVNRP